MTSLINFDRLTRIDDLLKELIRLEQINLEIQKQSNQLLRALLAKRTEIVAPNLTQVNITSNIEKQLLLKVHPNYMFYIKTGKYYKTRQNLVLSIYISAPAGIGYYTAMDAPVQPAPAYGVLNYDIMKIKKIHIRGYNLWKVAGGGTDYGAESDMLIYKKPKDSNIYETLAHINVTEDTNWIDLEESESDWMLENGDYIKITIKMDGGAKRYAAIDFIATTYVEVQPYEIISTINKIQNEIK